MQDLQLIGVHEDGEHLLLASGDGGRFRIQVDEPLRAAVRHDRPRLGQLQIEIDGGLRPRDVQALIRAGASAEEAASRAGWSIDKVHRYEGPILAEREHVAGLARGARLRGRGSESTGGSAPTLSARVAQRLKGRGVDAAGASWDSWRAEEGPWTVVVTFAAGGRQRQASWTFDAADRTVCAVDDEARWLSEAEQHTEGPIPAPHLSSPPERATKLYDVEAEGGLRTPAPVAHHDEPLDLMTAMRERSTVRGRRGGRRKAPPTSPTALPSDAVLPSEALLPPDTGEARTDALPIAEITFDPVVDAAPPAAHTHPNDDPEVGGAGGDLKVTTAGRTAGPTAGSTQDGSTRDDVAEDDAAGAPAATAPRPAAPTRKGRPTVPSWDDIMFGGTRD